MTSNDIKILGAGLTARSAVKAIPDKYDVKVLEKKLNDSIAEMNKVPNLTLDVCWLELEDEDPAAPLVAALKKENTYDAIMVGWGVRGYPQNTALFEDCVQAVRENAPISTKLIFNVSPQDHLETIKRHFPHLQADV